MHSLTIVFGPHGGAVQFLFNERNDALKMLAASKNTAQDDCVIEDDFNQHAEIRISSIHGRLIEDLEKSGDAAIVRSIQNAKTQVKGNNKAANDPALKFSIGNGAAMNHPGMPQGGQRRILG